MKMVEVGKAEMLQNSHGVDVRKLYDTDHAQAMHIMLKPGESLKKHITPVDVFFYVLEGREVLEIGGERKEVGPDTLIESPAKIPHRWYNEGNELVRILVVKVPRPEEPAKIVIMNERQYI